MRVIANVCLVIGLLLWNFRSNIPGAQAWLDFLCGALISFSIVMNLMGLRRGGRCRTTEAGNL
ncbi:MAG: hypothetical protein ABSE99_12980 [Terracidiphilus sp.]